MNLELIMRNTKDCLKKSELKPNEKIEILKAFATLEKRLNQSIPEQVQEQWINDLINSGLSFTEIIARITNAGFKSIYGKIKLSDILNEEDSYLDIDLINQKANEKCWYVLKQLGISKDNFKDFQLNKFQQLTITNNENINLDNEKIKQIKIELLVELLELIPDYEYKAKKIIIQKIKNLK